MAGEIVDHDSFQLFTAYTNTFSAMSPLCVVLERKYRIVADHIMNGRSFFDEFPICVRVCTVYRVYACAHLSTDSFPSELHGEKFVDTHLLLFREMSSGNCSS